MNRSSTSPFRNTGNNRPATGTNNQSLELLIRSLQRENNSLVQEINILKNKNKKVGDLEQKIDLVLKHNTQLLSQNEKLAKLINQKKSQVQVWKSKYDTLSGNRTASSDLQNRRLLSDIQKLKQQITDIQHLKNMQISQLKNEHHMELQSFKRGNLNNNEKYQLEIRKLKQYCEKKQYEISDLNMKLVRLSKESEFEIGKLRQEKQRLRGDLNYEEMEHRKQVEGLKSKFDYNFHSQVQNLKKQHLNQIQALDYQNCKLKQVINSKNIQIQSIIAKNQKIKNNYQDSLSLLKRQNEDLKDKLIENQHIGQLQLGTLKDKLQGMRQAEMGLLRNAQQNQMDLLNRQINKMRQIIDDRQRAMESFVIERNQLRCDKDSLIAEARAEIQAQVNQNKSLIVRYEQLLKNCDYEYKCKQEELQTTRVYLQSQIKTLKNQRDNLNSLLQRKTEELGHTRAEFYAQSKGLKNDVQGLRNEVSNLKADLQREHKKSNSVIIYQLQQSDDWKRVSEMKQKQYQTNLKNLQEQLNERQSITKQLENNLQIKQDETRAADVKIELLQNNERQLRRQLRQNTIRWGSKQNQLALLIKTQTEQSQRNRRRQVDELNDIHDNKTRTLKHQLNEKQREIQDKTRGLNDLKGKYDELANKFEQIFGQRAAQKNLDIKVPGWMPEIMATKYTFDVFLKNKVLQYCS